MPTPHHVLMLALPIVQTLDVTGPMEVFAQANARAAAANRAKPYRLELAAPKAGLVETSCGIALHATHSFSARGPAPDTLIVAGGAGTRAAIHDRKLIATLRRIALRTPRVASVCTGAYPLAAAGLLDGRRATTHWAYCTAFGQRFPKVTVDPDAIFVVDGKFLTSAGVTAGIDLALAMVEQDLGRREALAIARQLVVFLRRPGGQSQYSAHLQAEPDSDGDERFAQLARWMLGHLTADLSVEALATRAAMSPRNFARRFAAVMGATPARYVQRLRLDAARRLLTEGDLPVAEVARRAGFGSVETMRLAFQRHLKVAPQDFRQRFHRPAAIAA
jgi:transcriptional regulator GlxA family with amidase domain